MKKNVCLLIYNLSSGGAEKVISQWSTLLAEDYNVYMTVFDTESTPFYLYSGELVQLDGVADNRNTFTKVITVLKRAKLLSDFVKEKKIDIVISFCNECNLVNTISRHGAQKICSIRGALNISTNPLTKFVINSKENRIIVQTEALKKTICELYGSDKAQKLFVFGNPFNCEKIRKLANEDLPENVKKYFNKKTIVNVGSFKAAKNHANMLRCFELVAEKDNDVYLILVGADSTGLEEKTKQMAGKSKYSDRIIFVGELSNPFPVMKNATVFILPSLAEGIPNAMAEAMICGAPVVAANCHTGPAELLLDNPDKTDFSDKGYMMADYGILTKKFDAKAEYNYDEFTQDNKIFADAILEALDENCQKELREKVQLGAAKFDIEKYQKDLIALVESF